MKKTFSVTLLFLLHLAGMAQLPASEIAADSLKPFTLENFYELILRNHPTAKQVSLLSEVARQEIRMARGNFDPKLEATFLSKHYQDKEYYSLFNSQIKFPSVLPIDPVVGMDRNSGEHLNPENHIGNDYNYQQYYAGFSIPLLRGMITDERRTSLRQATLFKTLTEADQVKLINKLLLEAAKEYWQWYYAYHNYLLLNNSIAIADEIFKRIKTNFEFGEAAMIDTIQAKITLQQRVIEQQEAFLSLQNARICITNFLWDSLSNPLELSDDWIPVSPEIHLTISDLELSTLVEKAVTNHPELQKLGIKTQQLEFEKKLAKEFLKPQLNLNYYFLNQPVTPEGNTSLKFGDDYKLGLDISFPLFLRKERSKLALTNLKLSNIQYEKQVTERQIVNDINSSHNRLVNIQRILNTQQEMVTNYEQLLNAELLNLEQGESDLFKINLQMEKLIMAKTKRLKLVADLQKEKAYLYWAAGTRI